MQEVKLPAHIDQGEGMPVVLIHGFCESKAIWNGFIPTLAQKYRVIALDLPGFGDNEPLTHALTIGDMSEAVYQLLSHLGVDHSVMIGHSLGGYVSLGYGEKFPQRLRGLGLFHSTAYSDTAEKKQGRNKTISFIENYGIEEFVEEFVTPLFYEGRKKELKDEIRQVIEIGKRVPKSTVIETIKAMRDRKDRSKVLERASFPVLYIIGRNDSAVSITSSLQQLGLAPDTTAHVMNNTGHMGMLERPAETLRMLMQFLESVENS